MRAPPPESAIEGLLAALDMVREDHTAPGLMETPTLS